MNRMILKLTILALLVLPSVSFATLWTIDPDHSNLGFTIRHMMISNVKGDFGKFSGTVEVDEQDITRSKAQATIETASVNTGVSKRDDDLRSPNFFEVAKYPTMTFVSRKVAVVGPDQLRVTGDLTIHGVTKEVILDVAGPTRAFKDPWGNMRRGVSATTKINRKDFGLTWNAVIESGGVLVGDEVNITLEIELVKK